MATLAQKSESDACLRLEGTVIDYTTKQPLSDVKLEVKLPTGRIKVSVTSSSGRFLANIPCQATAILIERTGYRSQTLSFQQPTIHTSTQSVMVDIPLIAIEHQANDRVYLQSEQTDYVHQSTNIKVDRQSNKAVQHGLFTISDAIQNTPLVARTCFFFTNTGLKRCVESNSKGQFKFDFTEADIIALEVTAIGYQAYTGNLIVESLAGDSLTHKIRLQRELTILSVQADSATHCELRRSNKVFTLINVSGRSTWFSKYDLLPGKYDLVTTRNQQTIQQSITLYSGMNYVALATKRSASALILPVKTTLKKSITIDTSSITLLSLPESIPMIYFEQGSYQLRVDSQDVLRKVASYLKSHQNYSILIEGHTDNVGDERLNRSLSEFRATVAGNFLIRQGIAEGKLTKTGHGSGYPISPNDTEANKALNRRVSLKLITIQ